MSLHICGLLVELHDHRSCPTLLDDNEGMLPVCLHASTLNADTLNELRWAMGMLQLTSGIP